MATQTEVQYVSDAEGKAVSVIVPIDLWQQIASERGMASPKPLTEQNTNCLTLEEWDAALDELAEGSENWPVLPPEAFERASFYGERG